MSAEPLPKISCGPVKFRKHPIDFVGTATTGLGHRLAERHCQFNTYSSPFENCERPEDIRELDRLVKSLEFEKETKRKIRRKNVHHRVEQGMAAYEETLNERREKLRDLVLREEIDLTRRVIDQAQHGDDSRMEEMRERAERLRKEQEDERLALVAAKRMQQYLVRCTDVRERISKNQTVEVKRCNLVQIAHQEERKEAEKRLDVMWHELMIKEMEVRQRAEEETREKRVMKERRFADSLAKQMEAQLLVEEENRKRLETEEREELARLWESIRQEEVNSLEEEKKKRAALKKELEEQIAVAQRFLVERARQEAVIDRMYRELADEELKKEKAGIKASAATLRGEMLAYLKYLEELKVEDVKRNMEVNAIVEQSYKDAQARRDLAVRKFKEARLRGLQDVLRGRAEQLQQKRDAEEEECRAIQAERALVERQIEQERRLIEMEKKDSRKGVLRYRRDLEEQQKYVEEMRKQEKEENMRIYREGLKREEEYQKLTEELLKTSENITPHPFKTLLKEFAACQKAEKEGRLYCPPPLPATN